MWTKRFSDNQVTIKKLLNNKSWKKALFNNNTKEYEKNINELLTKCLTITEGRIKIYPNPENLFNAFDKMDLKDIKVVILGQDPYHNKEIHDGVKIPQAMGLSFSVDKRFKLPSSLKNIFKNLIKYKHIDNMPNNGDLSSWAKQGVLLLNSALTVQHGHPNSHANTWKPFTDSIIEYISDNCENVVFVLWGSSSLSKLNLIDTDKHKVSISSHPSGLSCNKPMKQYPSFMNTDHFTKINEYLKEHNKKTIKWNIE